MLANHWVWRNSILGHHWVDLIMYAQWEEERTVYFGGKHITLKRGQQVTTTRQLMQRWNTNPKMVLKTLEIFEEERMIECEKNNRMTIITLCNYDDHQSSFVGSTDPDIDMDSGSASVAIRKRKKKRDGKQIKEDNNKITKKEKQIIVVDDDELQKKYSEIFLSEEKIKQGSKAFSMPPEKFRKIVEGIVNEWIFTNEKDWSLDHLRNYIKKVIGDVSTTNSNQKKNAGQEDNAKENKRDSEREGAGQNAGGDPLERAPIRGSKKRADKPQ